MLLRTLRLFYFMGHCLVEGCRLTSWLQKSDFHFPALLVASLFSFHCLLLPSASLLGENWAALPAELVPAKNRSFLWGDVVGAPPMGSNGLQSTGLGTVFGVEPGVVGLVNSWDSV